MSIKLTSQVYVNAPGPYDTYGHFAALFMSTCLIFQCGQLVLLGRPWSRKISRFRYVFRWVYSTVIVLTTFMAGVGWGICGIPDATAVQFLTIIVD
jgi:hypothetical protein